MSRRIIIDKYEGNTHWSVHVYDSFNQEHHLGYYKLINKDVETVIQYEAEEIWSNEVKNEVNSWDKAIKECIKIDKESGITSRNRDCLD